MSDSRMGLPRSESAESAVLGAYLRNGALVRASRLEPIDFYSKSNEQIFEAIKTLSRTTCLVDVVSVAEELRRTQSLNTIGGETALMELSESCVSTVGIEQWEIIVLDKAVARAAIEMARRLETSAMRDDSSSSEVVADFSRGVADLVKRGTSALTSFSSAHGKAMEPRQEGEIIQTGIRFLDSILSIRPGQLGIIAGRPGEGKTSLATQIAVNISKSKEVLIDSLEMSPEELAQRMIAQSTKIAINDLERMELGPNQKAQVKAVRGELNANFCRASTVQELRAAAMGRKAFGGLRLVIVDYLQLMRVPRPTQSRVSDITEISRDLKLLAMDLDVPVIALSQFSREAAKDRPQLHHLRDSGSIEQDADWILFVYSQTDSFAKERWIELAKCRRGPKSGQFKVLFDGGTTSFEEIKR